MAFCKSMVAAFDKLPKVVKVILALPGLDISWLIYRAFRSGAKKKTFGVVLAILFMFIGVFFMFILDIITICISNKVLWID